MILVEQPISRFVVSVFCVIIGFGAVLALIFVPKIVAIVFNIDPVKRNILHASHIQNKSAESQSEFDVPKASDPGSTPLANLAAWRRNSAKISSSRELHSEIRESEMAVRSTTAGGAGDVGGIGS